MTMRYARAAFYSCDAPGCTVEVDGFDDRLPEGWTETVGLHVDHKADAPRYRDAHRCPAHSNREPK